ncbi:MAG: hypothetical protein BWZ10_01872 [candidate division BRC1 bacterium ADurb.BinA364]|nr:MAG: hypothetical protein BWZ10_01872 [candidate division BRC1 bacterium ADurb.BinA364]
MKVPSSSFNPLNSTVLAMRDNSDSCWLISAWIEARFVAEFVSEAA